MKLLSTALTACFLALSAPAATNDIETAVLRFPETAAWEFRPDVAVECANALIRAGRDSACDHLRQLASKKWESIDQWDRVNRNICLLCRLVFTAKSPSEPLEGPRLGALSGIPHESMSPQAWPALPFVITNEVPLSMSLGYVFAGFPQRAGNYLTYCASNGVFRTTPFPQPTAASASNALQQVFLSPAWKALKWKDAGQGWSYDLDEDYAKERLWKQVANMANLPARANGSENRWATANQATNLDNTLLGLALTQSYPGGGYMVVWPKAGLDTVDRGEAQYIKDWLQVPASPFTNAVVASLVDRLFERNKESGTKKAVQLSLPSAPKDGYVVDYDGKYRKYFQNDGGGWPRFYEEDPQAQGLIIVSLPAYDEETGLVVLYKGTRKHGLQGWGEVLLYRYEKGKLRELKKVSLWLA